MNLRRQDQKAYQKSSFFTSIALKDNAGNPLRLSEGEMIIFGIREFCGGDLIVKKVLTSDDEIGGVYPIVLSPEEMNVIPTRYYYDVSVQFTDGSFIKIVPKSNFDLCESFTEKEEEEE